MQAHDTWPTAVRSAAEQAHDLVAYLLNGADDPGACAELARLADVIRAEAATQTLDELERVAESVAMIAQVGVIDSHTAAELDAAVERMLVLADWASPPLELATGP
jgi:hypothetical protein